MARPRRELDAALQRVYDRIPTIKCAGQCWTSCGPINMSHRERQRIRMAGVRITDFTTARADIETYWCEALDAEKRCAVYTLRPAICRLWGVVEGLPCMYGCRPEGGYLTNEQGLQILVDSMAAGGGPPLRQVQDALAANPEIREAIETFFTSGRAGDLRRALRYGSGATA